MSIQDNINNLLDNNFQNHNYLPQKLELIDLDAGMFKFITDMNFSVEMENGIVKKVPVIYTSQELWAERKNNWSSLRNEYGEEITRPFMALIRKGVQQGTSPLKRTIPNKKKFTWLKVPVFDGNLKNYVLYKIPQPAWVDLTYELVFISRYVIDVNKFYETLMQTYSDLQGYMNINGYYISSKIESTSETKEEEIDSENQYTVSVEIKMFGKLVDPKLFEKVNTVNKIVISITEKKSDQK